MPNRSIRTKEAEDELLEPSKTSQQQPYDGVQSGRRLSLRMPNRRPTADSKPGSSTPPEGSELSRRAPPFRASKRPSRRSTPAEEILGRKGFGLRAKLLLLVLPLVNLALLGVWLVSTVTARSGLLELSSRNLATASHDLASAFSDALSDAYADTRTTAALDLPAQAIESGDPKNMNWYANELVETKAKYVAIVVSDTEGEIVAANTADAEGRPLSSPLLGLEIESAEWLQDTLQAEKGTGTLVPPGRPQFLADVLGESRKVVGFSFPVFDIMEDVVGTVTAFVSMDFLAKSLASLTTVDDHGIQSLAAIVGADGHLVALPQSLSGQAETWLQARWPKANGGQVVEWKGPGQTPFYLAQEAIVTKVLGLQWQLATMRTVAAVERPVKQMGTTLLWVSIAIVLFTTVAIAWAATRFVAPISRLTLAIEGTGRAADFKPLPIETRDEVGVLAGAFNRMFRTIVDHEQNLEKRVEERTAQLALAKREVQDILDNMLQGVFTLSEDGTVDSQYSAYCEELFGDTLIAGAHVLQLLQMSADSNGEEEFSRMQFWIKTIYGADDFQWMLSTDEGIRRIEYQWRKGDQSEQRIIELEYAPIYSELSEVRKVMVLARDVTALEALKAEVELKDKENRDNIDRVAELNNLDAELFSTFISESGVLIAACKMAVEELRTSGGNAEGIDQLFRSMHTLKGNSRIFKIQRVQDMAHQVESQFDALRASGQALTPQQVQEVGDNVGLVERELASFEALGRRVLLGEKGASESNQVGAFEFVDSSVQKLPQWIADAENLEEASSAAVVELRTELATFGQEVARLGLSSLASSTSTVVELLNYDRPHSGAVLQVLSALQENLHTARALGADLKGVEAPAETLCESAQLLAKAVDALTRWKRDVSNPQHVNAVLRPIDSLVGLASANQVPAVHQRAANLSETLANVRDAGEDALTYQTVLEVRSRAEALHTLLEDGYAFVGHEPPFGGALSAIKRMVLGLNHHMLKWNRSSRSENSARVVYKRAHECRVELSARGLNWLAEAAKRLEESLANTGPESIVKPLSERVAVAAEQRFEQLLFRYQMLKNLDAELRAHRNSLEALEQLTVLTQQASVNPRTGAEKSTWEEFVQVAEKFGLSTLARAAKEGGPHNLSHCVGLIDDAYNLIQVAGVASATGQGEIAKVSQERLRQLSRRCAELTRMVATEQGRIDSGLRRVARDVEYGAWALTATPLGPLFARMRKMVFGLGVELDRGLEELRFDGAGVLVDTRIVDKVRDILIHTLRNSVDHGIEPRRDRERAGKPPSGRIAIHCTNDGGTVCLTITDDGRGINIGRVKELAVARGLLTASEADELSEQDAIDLIFRPGFSTNKEVTDVSGRGVGMDVVKCTVEELGGRIELTSVLGGGTTTRITLPSRVVA